MGSPYSRIVPVPPEDFNELKNTTRFTRGEIEYLYVRFRELGRRSGRVRYVVKRDFIFPFYALHSLILNAMFGDKYRITFVEFATFLHIFKPVGKTSEAEQKALRTKKLKLLFSLYDVGKDGEITKRDLMEIVYRLISNYTSIHKMVHIVNVVMKEMDEGNTGRILFNDFCKALDFLDLDQLAINFPVL